MSNVTMHSFSGELDDFFARWAPRAERRTGFEWGVGSDDMSIFEEVDPVVERHELDRVRAWRQELAAAGLAWVTGPIEYGGRALGDEHQLLLDDRVRRHHVPGNAPLTISLGMIAPTILAHGTAGAKRRYLEALHSGELVACQLFSEPSAGSDLAGVSTRASRDGDGWRVSGQKVWTSGAHLADIGVVLCRTADGPRHRNITAFVVDMRADGVDVRPLRQMTGGAAFNEVFLDDVWIPDDDRLGELDDGWRVAMTTLSNERNAIGGSAFGGKGLLSIDRLVALLRHTGLADDPLARQSLARVVCGLRTSTWTRRRLAATKRLGPESSMLKLALCRDLAAISALVSQLLGARLIADAEEWGTYAWSSFVLGLPGYRIGGGTDEIMRNALAERVLGLPKEPKG